MEFLVAFYVAGVLDSVCEDWKSAENCERYLLSRHNSVAVITVICANPWDVLVGDHGSWLSDIWP